MDALYETRLHQYREVVGSVGYLPTMEELKAVWGLRSKATVFECLGRLREAGHPCPTRGKNPAHSLCPEAWEIARAVNDKQRQLHADEWETLIGRLREILEVGNE